jgi:hypothetical protein
MDEAVECLKRYPNPMPGESDVEIRPVYEFNGFREKLHARGPREGGADPRADCEAKGKLNFSFFSKNSAA